MVCLAHFFENRLGKDHREVFHKDRPFISMIIRRAVFCLHVLLGSFFKQGGKFMDQSEHFRMIHAKFFFSDLKGALVEGFRFREFSKVFIEQGEIVQMTGPMNGTPPVI